MAESGIKPDGTVSPLSNKNEVIKKEHSRVTKLTKIQAEVYEFLKEVAAIKPDKLIQNLWGVLRDEFLRDKFKENAKKLRGIVYSALPRRGLIKKVSQRRGRYGSLWEICNLPYYEYDIDIDTKGLRVKQNKQKNLPYIIKQIRAQITKKEKEITKLGRRIEKLEKVRTETKKLEERRKQLEEEKYKLQITLEVISQLTGRGNL